MFELNVLLMIACILFLASTVMGLTGFGFALSSLPLLTLFLTPQEAVPLITICSTFMNSYTLYDAYRDVRYREIIPLVVSGIIGMVCGSYFLVSLDSQIIRLVIGLVTVVFTITSLKGFRVEVNNTKLASVPVGFLSGLLGGSMSISGPPIVLFFNNQNVEKHRFRVNLIAYFFSLYLAAVPAYFLSGLITMDMVQSSVVLVPVMFIGATLGIRMSKKIDEELFKRLALALILVTGLMAILTALGMF